MGTVKIKYRLRKEGLLSTVKIIKSGLRKEGLLSTVKIIK